MLAATDSRKFLCSQFAKEIVQQINFSSKCFTAAF